MFEVISPGSSSDVKVGKFGKHSLTSERLNLKDSISSVVGQHSLFPGWQ